MSHIFVDIVCSVEERGTQQEKKLFVPIEWILELKPTCVKSDHATLHDDLILKNVVFISIVTYKYSAELC